MRILPPDDSLIDTIECKNNLNGTKTGSLEEIIFATDLYHSKYNKKQVIPCALFTNKDLN